MSSVFSDLPGPRAVVRNRLLAVIAVLVVAAFITFIGYRLAVTGQFSEQKWRVFSFPQVWEQIGAATGRTLLAFSVGAVASLVIGFGLALGRLSDHRLVSGTFAFVTEVLRAIPVLVLMMIMYYGLPVIGQTWVTPFTAVVTAVSLYSGAVLAEVFRTGVDAVPRGQPEAAYALGFRKTAVMRLVLLPQAVRAMLPVIVAQMVVVLKDTALGFVITYQELLYLGKLVGSSASYSSPIIPAAMVVGSIYIGLCLILAGIAKLLEVRLKSSPKSDGTAKAATLPNRVPALIAEE
ncbi:amino acid ABC transporter permease [Arthrobacter nitrophenolicus]|uniref:Amino acid ABC transporter permease n=1 Tax=Arthrobacter nitrophenolicus TaxID=683150 RepID=A0A4R5Y4Z4_9MICC|nr:amino acid ABC transporter permease [Arthrobacter nitrophenolicus]TDL39639.1 amino acid ABC transporter permease [Arthrobacter nitrophenolicus]